ncbi:hypothetical protein [Arenibacter latericius]|uniref:hypothetical protein n=1 Tax=Arenibacter latericius TaxID=86104 RepID=UPI0003F7449D|nr:hypothetical protein [Arenibacter latericius]
MNNAPTNLSQNLMVADTIETIYGDFIYLKKDISPSLVLPFDKLYGVICDIEDSSLHTSGIPNELITPIDMSIDMPHVKYEDEDEVAYFLPPGYGSEKDVINIVMLFNDLSSIKLTIFIHSHISDWVMDFANEHIDFKFYNNPKGISITTGKVITYGYCTRSFIRQGIPTIVIGPYGLGGWVTPDNIEYLIRDNFKGRPGGHLYEPVPLAVLVDEFLEIKENLDLKGLLEENVMFLVNGLNKKPERTLEKAISNFKDKYGQIKNTSIRWALKPRLASNIRTVENGDIVLIQRAIINDLLFSLDKSELEFLEDLNGETTCKQIQDKYEMETNEFWDIMLTLWQRKAIIF